MINKIIGMVNNCKPAGDHKYRGTCPSHGSNKNQSLMIFDHGDKVGFHCFAGCDIDDILGALGMEKKDLYAESEFDRSQWRAIEAEKRRVIDKNSTTAKLYTEICVLKQCLEARLFYEDPQINGKFEAFDREKTAIRMIPALIGKYYA